MKMNQGELLKLIQEDKNADPEQFVKKFNRRQRAMDKKFAADFKSRSPGKRFLNRRYDT